MLPFQICVMAWSKLKLKDQLSIGVVCLSVMVIWAW